MAKGFKTEQEQRLAIKLISEKIKILDSRFRNYLKTIFVNSKQLSSLNDTFELKTELIEDLTMTELLFHFEPKLPYEIKMALIDEFNLLFRE